MIDDGFNSMYKANNGQDDNDDFQEPVKFRIEVIGCKKQFIFEVPDSSLLR